MGQQVLLDFSGQPQFLLKYDQGLFFFGQPGVLHHLGRLCGDDAQQALVTLAEAARALLVEYVHDSDQAALEHHRDAQQRLNVVAVRSAAKARLRFEIVYYQRLAVLQHPARDLIAQAHGDDLGVVLIDLADHRLEARPLLAPVEEQDRALLDPQMLDALLHDQVHGGVERGGRRNGSRDLVEDRKFLHRRPEAAVFLLEA